MTIYKNLTCSECGNEEYNIRFSMNPRYDVLIECGNCGRASRAMQEIVTGE